MTHYVIQDGAQFWIYDHNPHDNAAGEVEPVSMVEYTERPVKDFDLEAAREARAWFCEAADEVIGTFSYIFLKP